MAIDGREPDGTLWISQDEICRDILLIPANEENVYERDYNRGERFYSEDEALAWHETHCPILAQKSTKIQHVGIFSLVILDQNKTVILSEVRRARCAVRSRRTPTKFNAARSLPLFRPRFFGTVNRG